MISFGLTDRGCTRSENQDCFHLLKDFSGDSTLLTVCDGMGGHNHGSIAASLACEAFNRHISDLKHDIVNISDADILRESAAYANLIVYDKAFSDVSLAGMGSTLVAALISGHICSVVNVGDSRCYWIASDQISQVTKDHSLVQDMVDRGDITLEEAAVHPKKNYITRAIGTERVVKCDIYQFDLCRGDYLILCSDGVSNLLSAEEIQNYVLLLKTPSVIAEQLIKACIDRGAPDNITVIAAMLDTE